MYCALCTVLYVRCTVYPAPCTMYYALLICAMDYGLWTVCTVYYTRRKLSIDMYCVLCTVYHILHTVYYAPCTMYYVLGTIYYIRCPMCTTQELCIDGFNLSVPDSTTTLRLLWIAKDCRALRSLSLEGTHISPDALCAILALLVQNPNRRPVEINCARNALGRVGGLKLAAVLDGGTALAGLDVSDNGLGAESVEVLADVLAGLRGLKRLSIGKNIATVKDPSAVPPPWRQEVRGGVVVEERSVVVASWIEGRQGWEL